MIAMNENQMKSRGKRADGGGWAIGYYYWNDCDNKPYIMVDFHEHHEVIAETVGRFTGKHDKHKREIYAGDQLRPDGTCRGISNFIVEWNDKHCCFTAIDEGKDNYIGDVDESIQYHLLSNLRLDVIEISGSIYDNPELITFNREDE